MDAHYRRYVRSGHSQKSLRELLESPLTVLVGVDDEASAALTDIDVGNVHDLATSPVFDVAHAVYQTVSSGDPSGGVDRTTAVAAANEQTDGDMTDLAAADIDTLAGVDSESAESLGSALGVATVRDLARWPPYHGARAILAALTGEGAETEDGVPEELVPVARKYATEQTFYTKVFIDELVSDLDEYGDDEEEFDWNDVVSDVVDHGVEFDWSPQWARIASTLEETATEGEEEVTSGEGGETESMRALSLSPEYRDRNLLSTAGDRRIDITKADADVGGFRQPAVGGIIQMSQKWVPQGLSLGQLLHSTTLAPGESTKVAVIDWSRRKTGERQESESQQEETQAEMVQNRSIQEVQDGVTKEVQEGASMVSTTSTSSQRGGTRNQGLFGMGGSSSRGQSHNSSTSRTVSKSKGKRKVHAEMSQNIRNSTQQHASSSRTRRASVIRETEQQEHEEVRTRVLTNHNHMHALNVHYYEVVQIFRVEVGPEDAQPILFVPFKPLDFTNRDLLFKHRQALKAASLDQHTRELINGATGFVDVLPDFELDAGDLGYDVADQIGKVGADLEGSDEVSMPRENTLVGLTIQGPVEKVTVYRSDDNTTMTAHGEGSDRFNLDTPVTFDDVDTITATLAEEDGRPDSEELPRTIVIDSGNDWNGSRYSLHVSGKLEQASGQLHGLSVSSQGNESPSDGSVAGKVSTGRDGYRFSGEIKDLTVVNEDEVVVYVDGEEWEPGSSKAIPDDRGTEISIALDVERPDASETGRLFGTARVHSDATEFRVANVVGSDRLDELMRRLNEECLHYSQAVWRAMDPQTITMVLSQFQVNGRTASEFVDPTPEATYGNYVAFPLAIPDSVDHATDETYARLAAWWNDWTGKHFEPDARERDLVPLPSGGVHGESVLGRANGAEKLDITRFWDWQESPIPQQSPQIAPVQTGSRASSEDLTPSGFDQPIVQMQEPQQLPDPTGVGAVLDTLGKSGVFRDMSGIDVAGQLAESAQQLSGQGARHATDAAVETFKSAAQAQNQALGTITDAITSSVSGGGGKYSASNAGNSSFGAALNEAKKLGDNASGAGTSSGGGSQSAGGTDETTSSNSGQPGNGSGRGNAGMGGSSGVGGGDSLARDMLEERSMGNGGSDGRERYAMAGNQMLPGGGGGDSNTDEVCFLTGDCLPIVDPPQEEVVEGPDDGMVPEFYDPLQSGNPLLDTSGEHAQKELSPNFTVGEFINAPSREEPPRQFQRARISPDFILYLEELRAAANLETDSDEDAGISVNSGYRSYQYQIEVLDSGAKYSAHCAGYGADIRFLGDLTPLEFAKVAMSVRPCHVRVGYVMDGGAVHVDLKPRNNPENSWTDNDGFGLWDYDGITDEERAEFEELMAYRDELEESNDCPPIQ